MGLKYPQRPSENILFREGFINTDYVEDNGGTITGSPTISNGAIMTGSEYFDYRSHRALSHNVLTIELVFNPSFAYNNGSNVYILDTDTVDRWYILKRSDDAIDITLGGVLIDRLPGVDYGSNWKVGEKNTLVIATDGDKTSIYLNNVKVLNEDETNWTSNGESLFRIGAKFSDGTLGFQGVFHSVSFYNTKWTAEEVADAYQRDTFREIDASKAVMFLPCRSQYNDGSDQVTENIGSLGGTVRVADGSTASLYPTQIIPHGFEYDGADDYLYYENAGIDNMWATGGSLSFMMKPYSDGEDDYGKIFDKAHATGWTLQGQDESSGKMNMKLSVDFDGGAGGDWTTTTRLIDLNRWNHIVIVYNGSNTTNNPIFYINGIAYTVGTGITETIAPVGTISPDNGVMSVLMIGRNWTGSSTFDGIIDTPAVWDFELTPVQARELYNQAFNNLNV